MKRTIATILAASLTSFALAQDATTAPAQKAPALKATAKAPTPQELLQKNIELMGGKDAWTIKHSRVERCGGEVVMVVEKGRAGGGSWMRMRKEQLVSKSENPPSEE